MERYNFVFFIKDGIAIIKKYKGCAKNVKIPTEIEGYPVKSVGRRAFYNCANLTSIEIPDKVIYIGDYAFYGCTGLASITIPDTVKIIGESAFEGCTGLTSIEIPNSATEIRKRAFEGCTSLTSTGIPNSATIMVLKEFLNKPLQIEEIICSDYSQENKSGEQDFILKATIITKKEIENDVEVERVLKIETRLQKDKKENLFLDKPHVDCEENPTVGFETTGYITTVSSDEHPEYYNCKIEEKLLLENKGLFVDLFNKVILLNRIDKMLKDLSTFKGKVVDEINKDPERYRKMLRLLYSHRQC